MPDVLTPQQRSYCMSRIKGGDTKPEVQLRKALWRRGLRYRLRSKLMGRPDLVFPRHKVVIFVDGCFWHRCPKHFVRPRTNAARWERKLESNVSRDQRVSSALKIIGWRVIRVWEHEIRDDSERTAARLARLIRRGSEPL
ncbi:MAG TPA: very short patch repair endonuclease [Usitatibacter sp.]|nr:very short patch repair endonuclease [Usitatibacter sp.]